MAFNTLYEVDGEVETRKDNETVKVAITQIVTDTTGAMGAPFIDVRVHASNDKTGWTGATKVALCFSASEDVRALIEMLEEVATEFDTLPQFKAVTSAVRNIRKPMAKPQAKAPARTAAAKKVARKAS